MTSTITINESMTAFKEWPYLLQYTLKQNMGMGIKPHVCWQESSTNDATIEFAHTAVLQRTCHLLHKGYHAYCYNFYSIPKLFLQLRTLGIQALGHQL